MNQRATFRWVAAPGSEILIPASTSSYLLTRDIAESAQMQLDVTMLFEE